MSFISVVSHAGGRVTKFQPFATLPEAEAHAAEFGGFASDDAGVDWPNWGVVGNTLVVDVMPQPIAIVPTQDEQLDAFLASPVTKALIDAINDGSLPVATSLTTADLRSRIKGKMP